MEIIDQRQSGNIKFFLSNEDILYTECLPDTIMTLEDGKESTRVSAEMVKYKPLPLLCDLTNVIRMSHECRKHFAGQEHAETFSKAALIVSNPISRLIGNFFLGLNKPLKPTRLFTNKEAALSWLKESY